MSYSGKLKISKSETYSNDIYLQENSGGQPPPSPPLRFLLQENGQFILQENGTKIELEIGTPE
jgi:hypothetical protein